MRSDRWGEPEAPHTSGPTLSPPALLAGVSSVAFAGAGLGLDVPLVMGTLATGAALVTALLYARGTPLGYLAPYPLFVLGSCLYILPIALTLLASGVLTDERALADYALGRAVWVSGLAMAAFTLALLAGEISARKPPPFGRWLTEMDAGRAAVLGTVWFAVGGGAVLYFVFAVAGVGTLLDATYGNRYLLMSGYGVLLSGLQVLTVGALVLYVAGGRLRNPVLSLAPAWVAFLGFTAWTAVVGSRFALVNLVVSLLVLRHVTGRRVSPWALGGLGALFIVLFAVHGSLGRRLPSRLTAAAFQLALFRYNPANSELGSAVGTLADVIENVPDPLPMRNGVTYVEGLGTLVPGALWPERPVGPARWYVEEFYPDVYAEGGAFAFSSVGEAYLNFGLPGVIAVYGLLGMLVGMLERRFRRYRVLPPWMAIAYAVAAPQIIMFSRNDLGAFLKACGVVTLAPLIALALAWRFLPVAHAGGRVRPDAPGVR